MANTNKVLDFQKIQDEFDIVIVDADNPRAVNGWDAYRRVHARTSQVPVVMLARKRPEEPGALIKRHA